MPLANFPLKATRFEIQAYKKPSNIKNIRKTHVSFTGSPQKHPYDDEKVILISDPFSTNTFYYEFRGDDISFVEELPTIVNFDEEVITMVRIWVKKKSIGIRCTPFVIEDISK